MKLRTKEYIGPKSATLTPSRTHNFDITWNDIFLSAVIVGRASFRDVFHYGALSLMEATYRAATMAAHLRTKATFSGTWLVPSESFRALDPSEKGAFSYHLGMVLSSIYARKELNVSWLMHLDVYTHANCPYGAPIPVHFKPSHKRPDFIGETQIGEWCVIEAKGRSRSVPNDVKIDARGKSQLLLNINGTAPTHMYALCVGMNNKQDALSVDWIDPPTPDPDGFSLKLEEDLSPLAHYETVFNILMASKRDTKDGIHWVKILGDDVSIGLSADVFDAIKPYFHRRPRDRDDGWFEPHWNRMQVKTSPRDSLKDPRLLDRLTWDDAWSGIHVHVSNDLIQRLTIKK